MDDRDGWESVGSVLAVWHDDDDDDYTPASVTLSPQDEILCNLTICIFSGGYYFLQGDTVGIS